MIFYADSGHLSEAILTLAPESLPLDLFAIIHNPYRSLFGENSVKGFIQ